MLQAALFYGLSRGERVPSTPPLSGFPVLLGDFHMYQENLIDPEQQEILKADDLMNRTYLRGDSKMPYNLFVAYFRTQRSGQAPHSPKNCLPGNGFVPSVNDTIQVEIPGRGPVEVNRYVVSRGDQKSLVLYWYQSRDRVVASEYRAKFFAAADAIRYNRSDTALVRTVIPVVDNDEQAATAKSVAFIQTFFSTLRRYFPA